MAFLNKMLHASVTLRHFVGAKYSLAVTTSVIVLFLEAGATCAAQGKTADPELKPLTLTETGRLESCFNDADIAWRIAMLKQAGLSKDDAQHMAALHPEFSPIIDVVYADSFERPWPYAIQYYERCAAQRSAYLYRQRWLV
jgi:hypothetical protein